MRFQATRAVNIEYCAVCKQNVKNILAIRTVSGVPFQLGHHRMELTETQPNNFFYQNIIIKFERYLFIVIFRV